MTVARPSDLCDTSRMATSDEGRQPSSSELKGRGVPMLWVGVDETPVAIANQLLVQVDFAEGGSPDTAILTFGYVTPPVIVGSPDDQERQIESLTHVAIRPVARVSLTPRRLREWVELLDRTIAQIEAWDDAKDGGSHDD